MKELHQQERYTPRSCVWELSLLCDLRCKHCGSYAGERRADELSHEELLSVADQLIELGVQLVTLGGGEPMLHPDWAELGRRLSDGGVTVNMISNGWSFDEGKLQAALDAGIVQMAFSVDGLQGAHDTIRRAGSFERVLQAMALCRGAGLSIGAVTHINSLNYRTLPEMRDLLVEQGVGVWQLQLGNPTGAMCEHSELVIKPAELLWMIPQIAALQAEAKGGMRIDAGDNVGYYGCNELCLRTSGEEEREEYVDEIPFWTGCAAGMQVLGIESNGNIKGCLSLPSQRNGQSAFIEGNLRDHSLAEIWNRPGAFAYNRDFSEERLAGYCRTCDARDLCRGGCAWTAFAHTGERGDNPYCFHRVAKEEGRLDLLIDPQCFREALQEYLAEVAEQAESVAPAPAEET